MGVWVPGGGVECVCSFVGCEGVVVVGLAFEESCELEVGGFAHGFWEVCVRGVVGEEGLEFGDDVGGFVDGWREASGEEGVGECAHWGGGVEDWG